ncbi:CAP domain-containing protein [Brachyspira innocens]|uniref:CAP domain-containing protein n=1 Tax=Brachyspira innocens TaxID=13264 RepID=A0ABT8YW04_9SPIR|nr:CAP domain-containing protein [Brachyspira innocens]MDO6993138.1 CAP domain-containing protein [Brachyspira innocens]MDO7020034.1 CAP domain-containing protein [Brachyspira innocens]
MKKYVFIMLITAFLFNSCQNNTTKPDSTTSENNNAVSSDAQTVFDLVNQERAKAGLEAYKLDTKLCEAANKRAQEIVEKYDHIRPNGTDFDTVLDEYGFNSKAYSRGENIVAKRESASSAMKAWMDSQGHKENILADYYTTIGIGVYEYNGSKYWVQLFLS